MRALLALALIAACHAAPESSEPTAPAARDPRIHFEADASRTAEATDAPDAGDGAELDDDEADDPGTEVAEILVRLRDEAAAIDDRCPDAPADYEGFEDVDGCPDLAPATQVDDRESDAIVDVEDRCPDAREDNEDIDGCPDTGDGFH